MWKRQSFRRSLEFARRWEASGRAGVEIGSEVWCEAREEEGGGGIGSRGGGMGCGSLPCSGAVSLTGGMILF